VAEKIVVISRDLDFFFSIILELGAETTYTYFILFMRGEYHFYSV